MNTTLSDILGNMSQGSNYSGQTSTVKVAAAELGAQEADNMIKVAQQLGSVIGFYAANTIRAELGFGGGLAKSASLQDMMYYTMAKVAEDKAGMPATKAVANQQAEQKQIDELAAHHATTAAQAAVDAVQSAQSGDEHTATQMMSSAASAISTAKNIVARSASPEVHAHVEECAGVVAQAADMAVAHAAGGQGAMQ